VPWCRRHPGARLQAGSGASYSKTRTCACLFSFFPFFFRARFARAHRLPVGTATARRVALTFFFHAPTSPPHVVAHLRRVYATLAAATAIATGGAWLNAGGALGTALPALAFIACALGLQLTAPRRDSAAWYDAGASATRARLGLLAGAAGAQGAALGPLVGAASALAPGALVAALGGSTAVFACFTLSAWLARRRSWLFLGGALSSAVTLLLVLHAAARLVGGGAAIMQGELYLGLLVFAGYVLFDSQAVVERAAAGGRDFVGDALALFVDAAALFTRLLILLLQRQQGRRADGSGRRAGEEEDERRRRRGYDPRDPKGKRRAW
jgi:Bax inhibitor 1